MQCQAITKNGKECTRETKTKYCWQHQNLEEKITEVGIDTSEVKTSIKTQDTPFLKLKFLGKGTSSNVYLCIYKDLYVAVKEIQNDKTKVFQNEINMLNILSPSSNFHPGIVGIHKFKKGNPNYLYLEYLEGASLSELVKNNKLNDLDSIFSHLTKTLAFIHSKNIVHRDIKLENIIFGLKIIKFVDFGYACCTNASIITVGTPMYMAPELWEYKNHMNTKGFNKAEFLKKIDVYALGIVFYILVNRKYPFAEKNKEQLSELILNSEQIVSESGTKYDTIINAMLTKNYKNRPFIHEVQI